MGRTLILLECGAARFIFYIQLLILKVFYRHAILLSAEELQIRQTY